MSPSETEASKVEISEAEILADLLLFWCSVADEPNGRGNSLMQATLESQEGQRRKPG
jgi:hypothetical protein